MVSDDLLIVKHLSAYHEVSTVNPDAKVMTYSDIEKDYSDFKNELTHDELDIIK